MSWKGVVFIILVTLLGAAARGLPDVKGTDLGASDKPRASTGIHSGGKHVCTDCSPDPADLRSTKEEKPNDARHKTNHHGTDIQSYRKITTKDSSSKDDEKEQNSRATTMKPFLSLGGIKIHVNEKHVIPMSNARHRRRNKHRRKGLAKKDKKETNKDDNNDDIKSENNKNIISGVDKIVKDKSSGNTHHISATKSITESKNTNTVIQDNKDNVLEKYQYDISTKGDKNSKHSNINNMPDSDFHKSGNTKRLDNNSKMKSKKIHSKSEKVYRKTTDKPHPIKIDDPPSFTDVGPKRIKVNNGAIDNDLSIVPDKEGYLVDRHHQPNDFTIDKVNSGGNTNSGETYRTDIFGSKKDDDEKENEVNDENNNKPDSAVLGGKIDDRWTSEVLSSVPDALRLERRLHPNVNAPIRDIRHSLRNILHLIQRSVYRAESDYTYAFNSTRWKLMVGVRERLKHLVEENDKVYGVVLQASLLTKDIYRRAHERRVYGNVLAPAAVRSRHEPVITAIQLRPLHMKARDEAIKTNDLKMIMTDAFRKKSALQTKYEQVRNKVVEAMSSRAMFDLSRRAKKTIYELELAKQHQDPRNGMSLHGHMQRNIYVNMGKARNLTHVGREELRRVKHQSMSSKKKAEDMLKRLRDRIPAVGIRLPFDQTSMLQWHHMEVAQDHADKVFKQSVFIYGKLNPLLKTAKEILKNYDKDSSSTQLRRTIATIRNTKQILRTVMDKIYLQLQADHLLRERCDEMEGSGYIDDELILIDCDVYEKIKDGGSGDGLLDEEGSGDIDGVAVDLGDQLLSNTTLYITDEKNDTETVDIEITDMTDIPTLETDEIDSIFIDGDVEGKLIDETDTPTVVDIELQKTTKMSKVETTTLKNEFNSVDIVIDKTTNAPKYKETKKPSIVISDKKDDEDLFKESVKTLKPIDIPAPTKTTESPPTTTASTATESTTEKSGGFYNIWPWGNDEPVIDNVIDLDSEDISNLTFNELLRWKLSNYSSISIEYYEEAKPLKDKAEELRLTWDKIKKRFDSSVNRTVKAQTFVSEWAAESVSFSAVHDMVQNVHAGTKLKVDVIDTMSSEAVVKAKRKVKMYKKSLDKAQEGNQDVDPVHVQEFKDSVIKAKENIKKITSLTNLASPCEVTAAYVKGMRANISELRHKIEQAKLLASSLQGAVQLNGNSFLTVPVHENQPYQIGLTNRLDIVLNVTEEEGTLVGVETKDTGSFILKMKDKIPRVIVVGKKKWKIDEQSTEIELEENTWYKLVLERFARTFNLTVYDPDTKDVVASNNITVDDEYLDVQSPVTHAYVGGLTDDYTDYGQYIGCIGSIALDGQILNLTGKSSEGTGLDMCTAGPNSTIYHREDSLVLTGTGFGNYRIDPDLQKQRIQSVATEFTPKSDGLVLSFTRGKVGIGVVAFIEDRDLNVVVRTPRGKEMTAVFKNIPYDVGHSIEIKFQGRPTATLNGNKASFKSIQKSVYFTKTDLAEIYVGAFPAYNRSLIGCIHSVSINGKHISLPQVWKWYGAHIGVCEKSSCVEFSESSATYQKAGLVGAESVYVAFHYGSTGPLLQYIKTKSFDISIFVDNSSIEIEESKGDNSIDKIALEGYSAGDIVILQLHDQDDEVSVSVGDQVVTVEYESEGGVGWFTNKKEVKSTYSVTVGTSTQAEDPFIGNIEEFIVDGSSLRLASLRKKNKYGTCEQQSRTVSHWNIDVTEELPTC